MIRLQDTVTIISGASAAEDAYGNVVRNWASTTETVTSAEVQPVSSSEDVVDQQRTEVIVKVFLPADLTISAADRVLHNGITYEVIRADPDWRAFGRSHHREIQARLITNT